jgi:hypothetical protein
VSVTDETGPAKDMKEKTVIRKTISDEVIIEHETEQKIDTIEMGTKPPWPREAHPSTEEIQSWSSESQISTKPPPPRRPKPDEER